MQFLTSHIKQQRTEHSEMTFILLKEKKKTTIKQEFCIQQHNSIVQKKHGYSQINKDQENLLLSNSALQETHHFMWKGT